LIIIQNNKPLFLLFTIPFYGRCLSLVPHKNQMTNPKEEPIITMLAKYYGDM
jgi:hypothetical protein